LVHMPNHRLPIVVETVNHANLSDARNFWVRLLEPDSKGYVLAVRLIARWMAARVTKAARVSARFS
jgi:hypothetical protein